MTPLKVQKIDIWGLGCVRKNSEIVPAWLSSGVHTQYTLLP